VSRFLTHVKHLREVAASRDVYAYFDNDWKGFAHANARDLTALVSGGRARGSRE